MVLNKITTFLSVMLLIFSTLQLSAQTAVPNGAFENWQNVGSNTEEPTDWNSNKSSGGTPALGPQTCFRESSNPHGGSYCVRVKTGRYFGTNVNGNCTTGRIVAPTFNANDGYIESDLGNGSFNYDFTGRPDSLVGWYRYTSVSGDRGKVTVILHTGYCTSPENGSYQGNNTANVVGKAEFLTPASNVGTWTRFSVPFNYVSGSTPEYFLGVMTSSESPGSAQENSTMWIDDLVAVYNPTLATGTINAGPHYVSASAGAAISVPFTATGNYNGGNTFTAQLSNASGSFASPVNIGSTTGTTSGTISATIPAGTASGTGYRVRVVSSNPAITAANNGSNIEVINVNASIAPGATQNIAANTAGNQLTLTASAGSTAQVWKYATTSGGPYTGFTPSETGTTYTPQFASAGTYYVVSEVTYPGSVIATSNEVQVNVVSNSIAPTTSQSLLVGVNGTQLTVTETPAGSSREWLYATTSGGPYTSFTPAETGNTYTPVFASAGTYYLVARSIISGVTVTSNEVVVSVGNATITTGTIAPLFYDFSPNAPDAMVSVPYTTSGTFNTGNVFTAELSDATGSFNSPTVIGTLAATGSGSISATIPHTIPDGSGYRIRVISDNPVVLGSDNGDDIFVDQFSNSVSPAATQTLPLGVAGNFLAVTESQNATREWVYATTSGGPYSSFSPAETGASYTPLFNTPGTYYIVAKSVNQYNDTVTSNEVEIIVQNGTTLTTGAISGSPFLLSPSANEQVTVTWTSDIVFDPGNVFTIELSDASGDFSNPTVLGTTGSGGSYVATIPPTTPNGNGYRIRVVSSSPAVAGTDNGTDLEAIQFEISVAPLASQTINIDTPGTTISIQETHPATREWLVSIQQGFNHAPFSPAETDTAYTPFFTTTGTRYVIVQSVNQWNDTLTSPEVTIVVQNIIGVDEFEVDAIQAWWQNNALMVDLTMSQLDNPELRVVNLAGQVVLQSHLQTGTTHMLDTNLPDGIYIIQLLSENGSATTKTMKQ